MLHFQGNKKRPTFYIAFAVRNNIITMKVEVGILQKYLHRGIKLNLFTTLCKKRDTK